jgi:hypothetical protein
MLIFIKSNRNQIKFFILFFFFCNKTELVRKTDNATRSYNIDTTKFQQDKNFVTMKLINCCNGSMSPTKNT